MQNIPKIARERLKAAGIAVDHPDADLLSAFAEQTLREAERATVVEHLARCAECRYVVAVALPAMEPPGVLVAPGKTWFSWPVLRWGFAVAGIAVIATFGVVHYQGRSSSFTKAEKSAAATAIQASNEALPTVAAPPIALEQNKKGAPSAAPSGKALDEGTSPSRSPATKFVNELPLTSGGIGQGSLPHGPKQVTQANQFQQQNANAFAGGNLAATAPSTPMAKQQPSSRLVANSPIPSESETSGMQPSSAPANMQSQDLQLAQSQDQELRVEGVAAQPSTYGHGEEKVGRAKEPTDTTVVHIEPEKTLAASRQANRPLEYSRSNARWAITSAGGLQRSLDQGNSWQDVNVNASPAPSAATTFDVLTSVSKAKARDTGKADKDKRESEPIVFRAVTANGSEVWAGGSAGQLYHSMDAGNHWSRVVPSAQGSLLTGDVVSLDFSDTQHGRVSTSTSEVWITGDDGLTWQRQ